ncbi:TIGR04283 family arsenosugar biosynthesis glycosyltransferase [Flaviaesturariibacter amylovorans]|uniref:TIGR04283 family arsenosugar biosynthesis glycosyltransferase n=1 Tax=Flaviaesturariibacter amylovorans TaxID=1084520 RepID=A0ABP8HNU1_9BACT
MITVIIPTYNEAGHIGATVRTVQQRDRAGLVRAIVVVDGGSTDATMELARAAGAEVLRSPRKGRAAQMNYGAAAAREEVLYFLHADTLPPPGFSEAIRDAVAAGAAAGCFLLSFDHPHWFLRANAWCTRFDVDAFRYGDQSLFVTRELFMRAGGFSEAHIVFEDYALIRKLKRLSPFRIIKKPVLTSARKYVENGPIRMQAIFYLMYFLYRSGTGQARLVRIYRRLIRQEKI